MANSLSDYNTLRAMLTRAGIEYETQGACIEIVDTDEDPPVRIVFAFEIEQGKLSQVFPVIEEV
jgi:hypothetical protein